MLSLSNDGLITILSSNLLIMAEDLIIASGSKSRKIRATPAANSRINKHAVLPFTILLACFEYRFW